MRHYLRGLPALVLVISGLILPAAASISVLPNAAETISASSNTVHQYRLTPARPNELLKADVPIADLETQAKQRRNDAVAARLQALQSEGSVQSFKYDSADDNFVVTLGEEGVAQLSADPLVASVAPDLQAAAPTVAPAVKQAPQVPTTLDVTTVNYIQVYSPFMWGKVHSTGVTVTITLEDGSSNILGVPVQTTKTPPNNKVIVDGATDYYETVFVNPTNSTQNVMIQSNNVVRIVSSGTDTSVNPPVTVTLTKVITVDDVQAWTSYQNDTVTGHTSLVNHPVFITVASFTPSLSNYLQSSSVTYAQTASDPTTGNFSASLFQAGSNPPAKVDLKQNSSGFVRVVHDDGNEVYTYHGQNVLPLENSTIVHGYAFPIAGAPFGLATGVAVTRPAPTVSITLLDSHGAVKGSATASSFGALPSYSVTTLPTILGGDTVQVQINGGPTNTITLSPLTAAINLASNQVTGPGPASTSLTLGFGRVDGFITQSNTSNFVVQQVSSGGDGSYASTTISCGTSGNQLLQPGSFGYVGFEDSKGNFPYLSFAAPRTDVMASFPYVEGWMALGTSNPIISAVDSANAVKSPPTPATPVLMWLSNQDLYVNTYYNQVMAQFNAAGDTVTVTQGLQSGSQRVDTIPIDSLTTYINTDDDTVVGMTSAGTTLRTIPFNTRSVYQTAVASTAGSYTIANPFLSYSDSTCTTSSSTQSLSPGAAGRTYITHADGNKVFATWGRSMHILENSNQVELYLFPGDDVDLLPAVSTGYTSTVTVTSAAGTTVNFADAKAFGQNAYLKTFVLDSGSVAFPIQNGASVSVSFVEGPSGGPQRPATINLGSVPLIIAAPDIKTSTLAGTGPLTWSGQATMTAPTGEDPVAIPARTSSAYGPFGFVSSFTKKPVTLIQGDTFNLSFTDSQSDRVWNAWTATSFPVEINPHPKVGDTQVCGTAQANVGVTLLNVSDGVHQIPIGQPGVSFAADSSGNFCITVDPANPLYRFEVLEVQDSNGTYSQPTVVIGVAAYVPIVFQQWGS